MEERALGHLGAHDARAHGGVVAALVFLIPTVALWKAQARFQNPPAGNVAAPPIA